MFASIIFGSQPKLELVFPQNKIPVDNWNTTFTIQLTKQSPNNYSIKTGDASQTTTTTTTI